MSLQRTALDNVGVEISGFDINAPVTENTKSELKALRYEHAILVFRDQDISPERQIEFSRIFGTLEIHPLKAATDEEHPELFILENGGENDKFFTANYAGEDVVGRLDWHMDLHYTAKPNHGALLRAVIVAAEDGSSGDNPDITGQQSVLAIVSWPACTRLHFSSGILPQQHV